MSNFWERLGTLETGSWARPISRTRFIRCAVRDGRERTLQLPVVLAPEVVFCPGKVIDKKRLVPDSLIYPVPATLAISFKMSRTIVRSAVRRGFTGQPKGENKHT